MFTGVVSVSGRQKDEHFSTRSRSDYFCVFGTLSATLLSKAPSTHARAISTVACCAGLKSKKSKMQMSHWRTL